jgi:hypothetical protein
LSRPAVLADAVPIALLDIAGAYHVFAPVHPDRIQIEHEAAVGRLQSPGQRAKANERQRDGLMQAELQE